MPNRSRSALFFALMFLLPAAANAQEAAALFVKSKYFSVFGPPHMNVLEVLNKINYDYFLQPEALVAQKSEDPKLILGETVDALLREASRVLGINVYSFQATLQFLPDREAVKITIQKMAGVDVNERGFYLDEAKTIFISIQDLTAGVLGHEMAHALVSHYFGAPPAANIQEILAGYVDYSFSKEVKTAKAAP